MFGFSQKQLIGIAVVGIVLLIAIRKNVFGIPARLGL